MQRLLYGRGGYINFNFELVHIQCSVCYLTMNEVYKPSTNQEHQIQPWIACKPSLRESYFKLLPENK